MRYTGLPDIEELLHSVLEDFRVALLVGAGPGARIHSMSLPRFTAVGATTQLSLLSAPLRGRFGIVLRLDSYDEATLAQIVERSARLLEVEITPEAAHEIAKRGRGTPRVANRLLQSVWEFAYARAGNHIDHAIAQAALDLLRVTTNLTYQL
jgi:holliday junction DNA helicase RuvB